MVRGRDDLIKVILGQQAYGSADLSKILNVEPV